jgi:hypothetical protein
MGDRDTQDENHFSGQHVQKPARPPAGGSGVAPPGHGTDYLEHVERLQADASAMALSCRRVLADIDLARSAGFRLPEPAPGPSPVTTRYQQRSRLANTLLAVGFNAALLAVGVFAGWEAFGR